MIAVLHDRDAMSRREAWLSAVAVFSLALIARAVAASAVPFPIPEDTAYYVAVARNLIDGHGLVSDALWSYQTPPLEVPRAAFEIWLPLPTFLIAIPMALLGPSYRVAQIVPIAVGALVPVLAWRLAADVATERGLPAGRARTLAVGTGVTAAVELPLVLHSTLADSTMVFAALALAACLLMVRLTRDPLPTGRLDLRLVGLGLLLGLAALTRNEAALLALVWVGLAWPSRQRLRLIGVPAAVGLAIFAPWAVRDWLVFGTPLPGQALANALSVSGFDIFAYQDPPTLGRYLAQGPARLLEMRVDGIGHNLFSVLLIPSFPIGMLGLAGLPWFGRGHALRPLLLFSAVTFALTSLAFPVATTWGTFLHAAGPVHVLLLVSCLLVLDAFIVRVGRFRGWTNPVAWLGPALTASVALLFSLGIASFGGQSGQIERRYAALSAQLTAAGLPLSGLGPVISDFPIWLAAAERTPTLGLPDEPPESVLALAQRFGAHYLVLSRGDHGRWPGVLKTGEPGVDCFEEIQLGVPSDPIDRDALKDTRVFRIGCP